MVQLWQQVDRLVSAVLVVQVDCLKQREFPVLRVPVLRPYPSVLEEAVCLPEWALAVWAWAAPALSALVAPEHHRPVPARAVGPAELEQAEAATWV